MINDIRQIVDSIVQEDDLTINIPLEDLVWTIVCFSYEMRDIEDKVFKNYPYRREDLSQECEDGLINEREYYACRRDELARLIGQYSDFDTQRIWSNVDKIFRDYNKESIMKEMKK